MLSTKDGSKMLCDSGVIFTVENKLRRQQNFTYKYRFYWLIIGDWQVSFRPISSNRKPGDQNRQGEILSISFQSLFPKQLDRVFQSEDAIGTRVDISLKIGMDL